MDENKPGDQPNPDDWRAHGWWGPPRHRRGRRFPLFGLVLFLWGLVWLGKEAGWWRFDDRYLAPVALIALGLAAMMRWGMRSW